MLMDVLLSCGLGAQDTKCASNICSMQVLSCLRQSCEEE
jgi:hypothetical protein